MRFKTYYVIIFCFALSFTVQLYAQNNTNNLLRGVYNKLQKVNDYIVQANIKVDMPFINMQPVDVQIYFKQKNHFKVISKGIAVVPRQGFDQVFRLPCRSQFIYCYFSR